MDATKRYLIFERILKNVEAYEEAQALASTGQQKERVSRLFCHLSSNLILHNCLCLGRPFFSKQTSWSTHFISGS